jgi:ribosomal protein S18 acetylase RimI-like enzyme
MPEPLKETQFAPIPPELRSQALQLLWAPVDADSRQRLIESFHKEAAHVGESYWHGLTGLFDAGQLTGVAWLQVHAGRAASLHGPVLLRYDEAIAAQLVRAALECKAAKRACIVQALLQKSQGLQSEALLRAGFSYLTDLNYLFRNTETAVPSRPAPRLCFESYSPENRGRLESIIERTYVGSLDCPQVDGVRSMHDVLDGYFATGVFQPQFWQLVSIAGEDGQASAEVGCLLLADQPTTQQLELVYMGVLPQQRGKGFGQEIVERAIQLAVNAARPRIVLAVDTANHPGLDLYESTGFHAFDERRLYLHVFSRPS